MPPQKYDDDPTADSTPAESAATRALSDESLVVRNHDSSETHNLRVTFVDHNGECAFDRTIPVAPLETVSIETRLDRGVYRVEVRLEDGETASSECLIGSDPGECALVEVGNGIVSVVEGLF
jgi:hypothetical protein